VAVPAALQKENSQMNEDVLAANLANWESRVPVHVTGYGLERFLRTFPTSRMSSATTRQRWGI
jgi:hypothetical protein